MSNTSNTNKYNKYNQNQIQNRSLFLPIMLCSRSSSIKDVKLSHRRSLISNTTSSSPSIGRRQVKRNNRVIGYPSPQNHQKLNFTTTTTTSTKAAHHDHFTGSSNNNTATYQKLRRFFSSRSLMTYTPSVASPASKVGSERAAVVDSGSRIRSKIDRGSYCNRKNSIGLVNCDASSNKIKSQGVLKIEELDPPLPVIKRAVVQQQQQQPGSGGGGDSNLWKRRFAGGASLQSLQVQSIIHSNNNNLPPAPVRTV